MAIFNAVLETAEKTFPNFLVGAFVSTTHRFIVSLKPDGVPMFVKGWNIFLVLEELAEPVELVFPVDEQVLNRCAKPSSSEPEVQLRGNMNV